MTLSHFLLWLLLAELAISGGLLLLHFSRRRSQIIAKRIQQHLNEVPPPSAAQPLQNPVGPYARLVLWDISERQKVAIPWYGSLRGLTPVQSFQMFAAGRIVTVLAFAAIMVVCANMFLAALEPGPRIIAMIAFAGLAAGWLLTGKFIKEIAKTRSELISNGMPYALDLILICLGSGTALETAISRVAAELSRRSPLVAQELERTLLDVNLIGDRELAFHNLGERIGTDNMRAIVTVLCQSLRYGSSLSEALKGAIQNMKRMELLGLEERAGKLPVQLAVPSMVLTFPQVIILLAGPGVLGLLDTFSSITK